MFRYRCTKTSDDAETLLLAGGVILKENKILLLRRIKTSWYELPGGKIDAGETPETAAIREIKEELLVDIKLVRRLGEKDFIDNGYSMTYNWFLAEIIGDTQPTIGEPDRFDSLEFIELDELDKYPLSPNMVNFFEGLKTGQIDVCQKLVDSSAPGGSASGG